MSETVRRPGRPRALTAEVRAKLIESIRGGMFLATACRAAGVNRGTVYRWEKKARDGHPDAGEYQEFYGAIKKASAQAEVDALTAISSASGDDWRAAAWFLERRFPERWGRRRR